jgi:CheY-like chemotaxis protein
MSATAQQPVADLRSDQPAGICILDDEPSLVEMLQEMISDFGYHSFGTTDPQEALRQVSNGRCRLVLCDLKMPAMDGLTFLQQALQLDPGVTSS